MTDYPNREHKNADETARRRALRLLDEIEGEVGVLRRRIGNGAADGDDTHILAEKMRALTRNLAILGTLAEVRDWDAADREEAGNG